MHWLFPLRCLSTNLWVGNGSHLPDPVRRPHVEDRAGPVVHREPRDAVGVVVAPQERRLLLRLEVFGRVEGFVVVFERVNDVPGVVWVCAW